VTFKPNPLRSIRILGTAFPLFACGIAAAAEPAGSADFFEKRIRPVLSEQCYKCHSSTSEKLKGGLMLDSREAWIKGGDTGPTIVPGDPEKSLLVEAIRWKNTDMQMPPKKALAPQQIADIEAWVKAGAPWPQEAGAKVATKKVFDLQKRKQEHWCWEPVSHPPVPTVKNPAWPRTDADRFILAMLEEKGLKPAPEADAATWIRRVTFAITGLPPAPEEVTAFVREYQASGSSHQSLLEKTVDRLLASPHFGERWARHWLDLVRYAETRGHEFEPLIPNAYQYRDYVIRALNADVRYDQFVTEHIAGDLMPRPRLHPATGGNESILGTGFWFLGEEVHSPVDIRQDEADRMDNRLDVMSKTFLGMTVACARCHDHKFDAISQRDYYALAGFLISSTYRQARFDTMESHREIAAQLDELRTRERPRIVQAVAKSLEPALQKTAAYLLAARDFIEAKDDQAAATIAARHSVNADQLALWAEELRKARTVAEHPLHAFAKVALDVRGNDVAKFAQVLPAARTAWQKQRQDTTGTVPPQSVVVDFAKPGPKDWIQDGHTFGLRPAKAGDPIFGTDPEQPVAGFAVRGCASRDAAWNELTTKGNEHDHGALGGWERSGNVIRTPDVTLRAGSLWYLVRGPGRAYAAVNSHLVIAGPLHGALLKEWKGEGDRWQWVEHKLTSYAGHRLHVQFSPGAAAKAPADAGKIRTRAKSKAPRPAGAEPLNIAMVVQSDTKPPLPESLNELVETAIASPAVTSPEAMAKAVQAALTQSVRLMGEDRLATSTSATAIADWLVRRADLFEADRDVARAQLNTALAPFVRAQSALLGKIKTESHTAPAMLDGSGVEEFVLVRGQTKLPGEPAPRRFIEAIAGAQPQKFSTGSGRLELAQQITAPANPFTARVLVNRVWHHLFGRGIVPTVDNFGVLGQAPSHRELLDFLATRFVNEQQWSVKKLIRELVLSRAYAMSSVPADSAAEQADPENILLHRANLRRLEGEAIRDAVLAISGRLDPKLGGPSVPVHLTAFMDGRGRPGSGPLDGAGRRSIYIAVRRNFLPPMMLAFDAPIPFTSMGRRNVSNVPAQALILMNDPFIVEQAKLWAKKLTPVSDPAERVRQMYLTAFSRPPTAAELADADTFLAEQRALYGAKDADERAWADFAHVLFNVKEFIYLN
jgi:hypothetical protein